MNFNEYKSGFFDFIKSSPTAFHAVESVKKRLIAEGYIELSPRGEWRISADGKYFTVKNGSSIIAFRGADAPRGFMICSAHSDTPSLRVKNSSAKASVYLGLDVEKYGGAILYSWLDRPLSVAGRVAYKIEGGVKTALVNIDRDLAVIPSVAIHQNRTVNEKFSPNPAVDMIPLLSAKADGSSLSSIIAEAAGADEANIISCDLYLYARDNPITFGAHDELILSPRLDDLGCVYAALESFIRADGTEAVPVLAIFDNEEVGSETKQGAASTFLSDTLIRIAGGEEKYRAMLCDSLMVSADNAHAVHPNHPELSDKGAPVLNGGVVVKYNAAQKYATDAVSAAVFKLIAERAGARTQDFYCRADMPCGSTLGSIADTRVSVSTVDIGLPQLAMHSALETMGCDDLGEMIAALSAFYSSAIVCEGDEIKLI